VQLNMYYGNFAEQSSQLKQLSHGSKLNKTYSYRKFGFGKMAKNKNIDKSKETKPNPINDQNVVLPNKFAKTSAVMLYSTIRIKQGRIFELVSYFN